MSDYDSSKVGQYKTVPAGVYLVKVSDMAVDRTKAGDEMWKCTFEIVENGNEFFGQKLFDNVVFSEKAMNRAKLIFEGFGLDVSDGLREYSIDDLLGTYGKVQVSHIETYTNKERKEREKSVIAYDGYFPAETSEKKRAEDSEIPY